MKQIILPSLLGAVVIFVWSFISWTIIGWHNIDLKNFPDQTEIMHMKAVMHEPGIYIYPREPQSTDDAAMQKWFEQYKAGPLVNFMVYNPNGEDWDMVTPMVRSFLIYFISAFIASMLLMMTLAQNPGFLRRVVFVMMLGLFAGFVGPFIEWNWWKFPFGYTIVGVIDFCVTWFIAGLVLAWRIKP